MNEKTATLDDLVDQVGNLTSATTDLLNATTESKGSLDAAVDEAKGHAQSANNANTSAVNAKEAAKTAATEAKEAEANATAIVHNDEGSVTPKAGAYPVADSKGHIDIGWTPLVQAMYPYSGVIGGVDKIHNFYFRTDISAHANQVFLGTNKQTETTWNIAGRFVKPARAWITLPEAESTADRAVAFDDIFLDWNGQVQTYRSITPHRTTTGYDRDAIATEHGYSKIQTGLYKTGDTYALLLGRVARRNKGAYHPVYNPEGSSPFTKSNGEHPAYWYSSDLMNAPVSPADCFKNGSGGYPRPSDTYSFGQGYIGANSGRQDNKPYDAIYSDDFTPLYYSAKNVIDRQALLFDSFNRAVAGETFSGAECTLSYKKAYYIKSRSNPAVASLRWENSVDASQVRWFELYDKGFSVDLPENQSEGNPPAPADLIISQADYILKMGNYDEHVFTWQDPAIPEGTEFLVRTRGVSARPQFLMVDIIGALDAMPDEWKTNGIPGNWLAVGEEGESLIPDGTQKNFKLSRKCLECYQVLSTTDKGVSWTDNTALRGHFEGASNSMSHNPSAATCYMIFYRTSANPFELADNAAFVSMGDVFATNSHANYEGSEYVLALIGKVPTNSTGRVIAYPNIKTKAIRVRKLVSDQWSSPLEHYPADLSLAISPAAKVTSYLAEDGHIHLVYKELKHNGTSWGDDNQFNIVNKQSTVTDLNGETIIVGQKRVEIPYQFDGVTY